jgi:hypothetical protein
MTLVSASITKRALQSEMPPAMRLAFLGHLDKMVDQTLTAEIIAMIEPMDDNAFELTREARKLGHSNALDVYADKWDVFAGLNPSLQRAMEKAAEPWDGSRSELTSEPAQTERVSPPTTNDAWFANGHPAWAERLLHDNPQRSPQYARSAPGEPDGAARQLT